MAAPILSLRTILASPHICPRGKSLIAQCAGSLKCLLTLQAEIAWQADRPEAVSSVVWNILYTVLFYGRVTDVSHRELLHALIDVLAEPPKTEATARAYGRVVHLALTDLGIADDTERPA